MGGVQSSTSSIPQMPNRIENGTNRPATARGRADSISGADMVSVSKTCHAPLGRQGLLNRSLMCFFMLRGSCRGCGFQNYVTGLKPQSAQAMAWARG
jgi:hypothetical protein